jgi:methionine-rich copper-binding protein CopC
MTPFRWITLALWMSATCSGWAHAFLDRAEPPVGSQVRLPPQQVKVWFTEKLEPVLCRLQVFDPTGQEVDRSDVRPDPANAAVLEVSLPALKPGKYKVVWRAVSVDTHVTSGTFNFEIVPW